MSNLKHKIKEYLAKENTPVYLIEKKLNLTNNLLGRILDDGVKYPSVENLIKLADAFNCTLDELIGRKDTPLGYNISNYNDIFATDLTLEELEIFVQATNSVVASIKDKKINATLEHIQNIIQEVFEYSTKTTPYFVDERFINWVLTKK